MGSAGIDSMAFGAESQNRDVTEPSTVVRDSSPKRNHDLGKNSCILKELIYNQVMENVESNLLVQTIHAGVSLPVRIAAHSTCVHSPGSVFSDRCTHASFQNLIQDTER